MKVRILSGMYKGEVGNLVSEDDDLWIVINMMGMVRDINAHSVNYEFI